MELLKLATVLVPLILLAATANEFHGRSAWTIDAPHLRVTILKGGGHIAEIVLKSPGAVNPLWLPTQPTMDPSHFVPARDAQKYGGGSVAKLRSGLCGHSLCFPYWGDPSPSEERAGMTYHGETGVVDWVRTGSGDNWLEVAAELPESRTRFTRRLTVHGTVVWFDETATNETAWDRPVTWCEHVTMGAPFLERAVTRFAASATRGKPVGEAGDAQQNWPQGSENGKPIDLSTVRNLNAGGAVNNYMVDPSREIAWFAAFNPKLSQVFGYIFRRTDFPWLNVWESYTSDTFTRGMEFSDTPVHGTVRAILKMPNLWGTPTFELLDAKGSLHKRFAAFSASTPANFRGVRDVVVEGAHLRIIGEKGAPAIEVDLGTSL